MIADMQQRGEHLWNALDLTATAWRETNAMLTELSALLQMQLPRELPLKLQNGRARNAMYLGGYVYVAQLEQWGLLPKPRRQPIGWLYANAALGSRDGAGLVLGKMPSLTVGYRFGEGEWGETRRADDPTSWEEPLAVAAGGRLIVGRGKPWQYTEADAFWHFCVPLFVLNEVKDLRTLVVTPVLSLLKGETPDVALGSHPSAFKFRVVDEQLELVEG